MSKELFRVLKNCYINMYQVQIPNPQYMYIYIQGVYVYVEAPKITITLSHLSIHAGDSSISGRSLQAWSGGDSSGH